MLPDPRIEEAHQIPMAQLLDRLEVGGLHPAGSEMVGPCPGCGGTDRFGVNLHTNVFNCRICGARGDQIALVQLVLGLGFRDALDWLCGAVEELTPAQRAEAKRKADAAKAERDRNAAAKRQDAIASARSIWKAAGPAEGTLVQDYLARRGITQALLPVLPLSLRFQADARYMTPDEKGGWRMVASGPAMVAGVQDDGGRLTAVHRTWLDLDQAKGKAIIYHPDTGALLPSKKVQGSKKGAAIRLSDSRHASTLVMAEGIETTLSALIARSEAGAAYWAGVDLGNMAGRRSLGPGLKYAGIPDMLDADAFVPPPWVRRLIYVQDGDSDPRLTRAKLEAGLRRAMIRRPGLRAAIIHAGQGRDLNDVLMGEAQ